MKENYNSIAKQATKLYKHMDNKQYFLNEQQVTEIERM